MERIVFLGDSITQGFKLLLHHDNISNMGISGNRTIEVIKRLHTVTVKQPNKLFLMIGINDFMTNHDIWFTDKPIDIIKNYKLILTELTTKLPSTKFYILSILPISSGPVIKEHQVKSFNNDIDDLNKKLENLAINYNLMFLDVSVDFKDEQNQLKKEYTYDGIHLSDLGYNQFYKKILKFVE